MLSALNALVSAGSIATCDPVPVIEPASGTIAAAIGCVLNPAPGTLSNIAASLFAAAYGAGFSVTGASAASILNFARSTSAIGLVTVTTRTPITIGSVHPAAS